MQNDAAFLKYEDRSSIDLGRRTHLRQVDSSTATLWTSLFSIAWCLVSFYYTPPHNSGGLLWFHVCRPSVRRPSVRFSFPDDNE